MNTKRTLGVFLLVLAATLLAYSNSFQAEFQFDDYHQVVKNQNIRSLGNIPQFFVTAGLGSYNVEDTGYRPLTIATFALNYAIGGNDVCSHHIFNVSLHIINALLVYLIVLTLIRRPDGRDAYLTALAAALVFALHPIQTNAVTYISGRAVLLASMFYLASFYCFIRYRKGGYGSPYAKYLLAASAPILYLSGLLSKEMAVSLPAVMLAYDLIFTLPEDGGAGRAARKLIYYVPFIAALIVYLAAKRHLQGYIAITEPPYSVWQYLLSESKALLLYLRLLILPMNQSADYGLLATESPDVMVAVSALLLVGAVWLIISRRRAVPAAAFFGAWFLIALAPESSLFPITDIAVEYRLYLPSVGFIAAAVILASSLLKSREALMKALALPLIAMLLVLTFNRNSVWATQTTLWADVAHKSPSSARAYANLGNALVAEGRFKEAYSVLGRSLAIDRFFPQGFTVYNNMGLCLLEMGMYEESIEDFRRAIMANPGSIESFGNMGMAYFKLGRYDEAADSLEKAVKLNPGYTTSHLLLSQVYKARGRYKDELAEAETALGNAQMDYLAHYNMAEALDDNGMKAEALKQAEDALGLAEDDTGRMDAEKLISRIKTGGR